MKERLRCECVRSVAISCVRSSMRRPIWALLCARSPSHTGYNPVAGFTLVGSDAVESFCTLVEFTDEPSCCRYDPSVDTVREQRTVKCVCARGESDDVQYMVEQVGSMTIVSRLLMVGTVE